MIRLTSRKSILLASALLAGGALVSLTAAPANAQAVIGGPLYVANTGHVIATFQGYSASYSDDLYLYSPTNTAGLIFNNKTSTVGSSKDLGVFNAGDELIFRLHVRDTNNDFYTGLASRNPDNQAHASVTYNPNSVLVGFEDAIGPNPDYNDLQFSFTNLAQTASAVPEPSEYAVGGMFGATLLFGMIRARRKSARKAA